MESICFVIVAGGGRRDSSLHVERDEVSGLFALIFGSTSPSSSLSFVESPRVNAFTISLGKNDRSSLRFFFESGRDISVLPMGTV